MNKPEKRKSAANIIHDILMEKPVGYAFTYAGLSTMVANRGHTYSSGCISGYLNRAKAKGCVATDPHKTGDHSVYVIVDRDPWVFHGPGIGSYPGRVLDTPHSNRIERQMSFDPPVGTSYENVNGMAVPIRTGMNGNLIRPLDELIAIQQAPETISQRLLNIAAEVEALESKDLCSYSTDALLREIRRRVNENKT